MGCPLRIGAPDVNQRSVCGGESGGTEDLNDDAVVSQCPRSPNANVKGLNIYFRLLVALSIGSRPKTAAKVLQKFYIRKFSRTFCVTKCNFVLFDSFYDPHFMRIFLSFSLNYANSSVLYTTYIIPTKKRTKFSAL